MQRTRSLSACFEYGTACSTAKLKHPDLQKEEEQCDALNISYNELSRTGIGQCFFVFG